MLVGSYVRRVSSLGDNAGLGPYSAVSIKLVAAVSLVVVVALLAVEARVTLCSYTYTLTWLDKGHLWSNSQCLSYNFYAETQLMLI